MPAELMLNSWLSVPVGSAILATVTAMELRHATVGYSETAVRAAVDAGLAECPAAGADGDPGFAELVTFWLLDPDNWEWFPPPLADETIAVIQPATIGTWQLTPGGSPLKTR